MSTAAQLLQPENTTVVLLAAGKGARMLPLTANTPKPLLKVGRLSLLEHHLSRLSALGFKHIVINVAYLAQKIIDTIGDGTKWGLQIQYSDESNTGALETAGGLKKALPLIKSDAFICINADVWTDFDFTHLLKDPPEHARLMMVSNPEHNSSGDFYLNANGLLEHLHPANAAQSLTFSGIAIYQKHTVAGFESGKQSLAPIFGAMIKRQQLSGAKLNNTWLDVGTPERLEALRQRTPI